MPVAPPALTTPQALAVVRVAAQTFRDAVKAVTPAIFPAPAPVPPPTSATGALSSASPGDARVRVAAAALWAAVIGVTCVLLRVRRAFTLQPRAAVAAAAAATASRGGDGCDQIVDDAVAGTAMAQVGAFF